jgi:ABC-type nitrate/sulfonate/bicarbonate transport system substrate-binding protein
MLGLDEAGMSLADIDVVDVAHSQIRTALERGDADAGVTGEPFVSTYLTDNPTATKAFGIETPMAQSTVVVATEHAIEDPALSAAVAEYLSRLDRAAVWNLDRAYIEGVLQDSEGVRMEGVPGDLGEPYRRLTELLAERGDIAPDLDTSGLFDDRYAVLFAP